ncbi:MAG: hypothetical protein EBX98_01810 [Burkholderiaceae bacterium]|nr:hypothetical protein [Burkholderiaceae bacterium]
MVRHDHAGPDVPDMILMAIDKGLDHSLRHSGLAKLIGAMGNRAEGDEKVRAGHPCRGLVAQPAASGKVHKGFNSQKRKRMWLE